MSVFDDFGTSATKEIEGIDVTFGPNADGSIPTFKLARMGRTNKTYLRVLDQMSKPHRRAMALGTMSNEMQDSVMLKVFVKTILKGWSNVQDKDGTVIPYSEENALAVLTKLPDLHVALVEQAQDIALFREAQLEAEVKN